MNQTDIQTRKEELFAQQQAIAEQLAALQKEEHALARAARQEGLEQIAAIIEEYKIPKHEVNELYKQLDLNIPRAPWGSRKKEEPVNNPDLTHKETVDQKVNQFFRLWGSGQTEALRAKAKELSQEELAQVLPRLAPEIEEFIVDTRDA